ncbi:MAG: VCBS repeat-containing protein, partial [Candidatus Zixiibacteriota bacterium]
MNQVLRWHSLHQVANQIVFLTTGIAFLDVPIRICHVLMLGVAGITIDSIVARFMRARRTALSGISSALSLVVMVAASRVVYYIVPLWLALSVKYVLRKTVRKQLFNVSNLALLLIGFLYPGHVRYLLLDWTDHWRTGLLFAGLGSLILYRLGLLLTAWMFVVVHIVAYWMLVSDDWSRMLHVHGSPAFVLFAFFFVTDPGHLSPHRFLRMIFAVSAAVTAVAVEVLLSFQPYRWFLALLMVEAAFLPVRWLENRDLQRARQAAVFIAVAGTILLAALSGSSYDWTNWRPGERAPVTGSLAGVVVPEILQPDPAVDVPLQDRLVVKDPRYFAGSARAFPLSPQTEPSQNRMELLTLNYAPARPAWMYAMYDIGYFAGVAVGDINRDGWDDVVLCRPLQPIKIYINREGSLVDMTSALFATVPENIEQVYLMDLDGDHYLDLITLSSPYFEPISPDGVYYFDARERKFRKLTPFPYQRGRFSSGGLSAADVDDDGRLDLYISYGIDWHRPHVDYETFARRDELLLNLGDRRFKRADYSAWFPDVTTNLAGMTVQFTDLDDDGRPDLLVGNDFKGPSFTLMNRGAMFRQLNPVLLEVNAETSMSYVSADFDNSGDLDLWENSISIPSTRLLLDQQESGRAAGANVRLLEDLSALSGLLSARRPNCQKMNTAAGNVICNDYLIAKLVLAGVSGDECGRIHNDAIRAICRRFEEARFFGFNPKLNNVSQIDRFPLQVNRNVLLIRDPSGHYSNYGDDALAFTGFSWAGLPFDVDNDGDLDMYLTNGMTAHLVTPDRLLLNESVRDGAPRFRSVADRWGANLAGLSRGAGALDIDHDGDLDLVVN